MPVFPFSDQVSFDRWYSDIAAQRHRAVLVVSGSSTWVQSAAKQLLAASSSGEGFAVSDPASHDRPRVVWLGADRALAESLSGIEHHSATHSGRLTNLLGGDCDALVIDCYAGFNPDVLALASGTLAAGALLLLLTPPLAQWPAFADPHNAQMFSLRPGPVRSSGQFLRRFGTAMEALLGEGNCALHCAQGSGDAVPSVSAGALLQARAAQRAPQPLVANTQQREVIAATGRLACADVGAVLVTAARGRGKSVALGLSLARFETLESVVLCAPHRANVDNLLAALAPAQREQLGFTAVDALLERQLRGDAPPCDWLFVDEAAALPLPVLDQLGSIARRLVLATTTDGYEGSGRGFVQRFNRQLAQRFAQFEHIQLSQPCRWGEGDRWESFVHRSLLLEAGAGPARQACTATRLQKVDGQWLVDHEAQLQQCFALLVDAHYQTRPSDLRLLLDTPYLHTWLALDADEQVQGVLMACEEGGFGDAQAGLCADIVAGRRRPQGNMVAQLLANHSGDAQWLQHRSLRVMRIAVDARCRRQGLGRQLIGAMEQTAREQGASYWSSSFGLAPGLLAFWQASAAQAVYLGLRRDRASGEHSAVVLRALDPGMDAAVQTQARVLAADLPLWLDQPLLALAPAAARSLGEVLTGAGAETGEAAQARDRRNLARFAAGELPLERVWPGLCRQLVRLPGAQCPVARQARQRLPGWRALAAATGLAGRRSIIAAIRSEFSALD